MDGFRANPVVAPSRAGAAARPQAGEESAVYSLRGAG